MSGLRHTTGQIKFNPNFVIDVFVLFDNISLWVPISLNDAYRGPTYVVAFLFESLVTSIWNDENIKIRLNNR